MNDHPSAALASFAATLRAQAIPAPVLRRTEDLFLDWLGSTLAGSSARAVQAVERYARAMGPADGRAEVLISRRGTSPHFAAMVNAAASHVVEQDDVHNGSVFHPAAVVFPAALAAAQATGASGREFLGRTHYCIFHTTATAGALAAAAATGRLLGLDAERMLHAFGSAGTQAAGLWEFLRDAADSKQLHCAHAASAGLASAWLAQDGFTGARRILEGEQGMAAGMSTDADPSRLVAGLGQRWATAETSFKYHASCRHTHPSADALLALMREHKLRADDIAEVRTLVHQGAIDVLGRVVVPSTVHQAKFSMGTVLGLVAEFGYAGLDEFDRHFLAPRVAALRDRVSMQLDAEVDTAYPQRWIGKVQVRTRDGRTLQARVDEPKGDPGNTLSRPELEDKARRLAAYGEAATPAELDALIERVWGLERAPRIERLLAGRVSVDGRLAT